MGCEDPAWRCRRVRTGNLYLDPETFTVQLNGSNIQLTQQEFHLLALFANNAGTVLPHRYIANQLWETWGDKESRRLSVLVSRLRALIKGVEPYQLETVRNRGYGLVLADRARTYDRQAS